MTKVSSSQVLNYFSKPLVLQHYQEATEKVGLWNSEKIIFSKTFSDKNSKILEIGCGTGRISFGLWEMGYKNLTATDFSNHMIKRSKRINKNSKTLISFQVEDARSLTFADSTFDGAIFGFNGLMQIPGRENRYQVMCEVFRLLKLGSHFVFTTHDRNMPKWKKFWALERKKWMRGKQNPELLEFGDRFEDTSRGKLYIHVPAVEEIRSDLKAAGFSVEKDILRSKLSEESTMAKKYSDECRFWIAKKRDYISRHS